MCNKSWMFSCHVQCRRQPGQQAVTLAFSGVQGVALITPLTQGTLKGHISRIFCCLWHEQSHCCTYCLAYQSWFFAQQLVFLQLIQNCVNISMASVPFKSSCVCMAIGDVNRLAQLSRTQASHQQPPIITYVCRCLRDDTYSKAVHTAHITQVHVFSASAISHL